VAWNYMGLGADLWSSQAQISGRCERDNLGGPPGIARLDLRFDDSHHSHCDLHLGRTLYHLHMAHALVSSLGCALPQRPRRLGP
jgi:hypothetical protein